MLPDIWKAFTAALTLIGLGLLGGAGTAYAENDEMMALGSTKHVLAKDYSHIAGDDLSGPDMVLNGHPCQSRWNDAA